MLKQGLSALKVLLNRFPSVKKNIIRILIFFPSLKFKINNILQTSEHYNFQDLHLNENTLSPEAREIYNRLTTNESS